jgi:murein DD-endopeptidase MepM/ murein hydrolase activator NlpD
VQKRLLTISEVEKAVGSKFTIYEIQGGPDPRIVLTWPLTIAKPSKPSTAFGADWDPPERKYCKGLPMAHVGVDIPASVGTSVFAAEDGDVVEVLRAEDTGGFAGAITIEHKHPVIPNNSVIGKFTTVSWHITPTPSLLAEWDKKLKGKIAKLSVKKGQQIATIAEIAGTDHLHFGVRLGEYHTKYSDKGGLPTVYCKDIPVLFPDKFVDPWNQDKVLFQ